MSHRAASLWLALACAVLLLPGFFALPPMDRDEPRFAQASKQMLETGDFVAIRFQDEARNKKPVGIYWLQAGAVALGEAMKIEGARETIWLYRLPSVLGAFAAVFGLYWAALPLASRRAAFVAAILFASTLLLTAEARLAKTDAVVAATVVVAMGALARAFLAREGGRAVPVGVAAAFWTALALGILVKGPITPMVPMFAAAVLAWRDRSWRWLSALRPLWGALGCAALVAPWLILIAIKTHGAFFADAIGGDMLGKVASGKELHGAPPLTYFAAFWLTGWPMAPFAALAAPFVWRQRRDDRVAFALAWLAPAWILFELVPTKLPHYVLPLYPAIAILIGLAWERGEAHLRARWRLACAALLALVPALIVVAGFSLSVWLGSAPAPPSYPFALAALAPAGAAAVLIWRRDADNLLRLAPVLALCVIAFAFEAVLTTAAFAPLAISPRLAAARDQTMRDEPACRDWPTATAGFREPSLVFLTRTDLVMTDAAGAAGFLATAPCRIAFIDGPPAPAQSGVDEIARVKGVNLNNGRRLDIGVYVRHQERHD